MSAEFAEASCHEQKNNAAITRRLLLSGALGALGVCFLRNESRPDHLPHDNLDTITQLKDVPSDISSYYSAERLNGEYTKQLLQTLEQEQGDAISRFEATKKSLRQVKVNGAIGTALQIDESGIYLTAKHAVSGTRVDSRALDPISIINPYTGEAAYAVDVALHPTADIAIVGAPSGKPKKPQSGLQVSFGDVQDSERLVMVSLVPSQNSRACFQIIEEGVTDTSVVFPDLKDSSGAYLAKSMASLGVKDLIPRGGSSGGPIVNDHGIVIGIESGAYPVEARHFSDYKGARVTPLRWALSLNTH